MTIEQIIKNLKEILFYPFGDSERNELYGKRIELCLRSSYSELLGEIVEASCTSCKEVIQSKYDKPSK